MPAVISNTSPIQYLYQAEALSLLPQLFGRIYVPEAVAAELRSDKVSRFGCAVGSVSAM